jgi:ribosome-interacting GTPase 1
LETVFFPRVLLLTVMTLLPHAQLARYRAALLEGSVTKSVKGEGFDVAKAGSPSSTLTPLPTLLTLSFPPGYGRAVLIGFPSVGKSTLLSKVTNTESHVAAYAFTTLVAVPGVLDLDGAKVQCAFPSSLPSSWADRGCCVQCSICLVSSRVLPPVADEEGRSWQ